MIHTIALFIHNGGIFIWFLLAVLAVAVAVVVERLIYYFVICRRRGEEVLDGVMRDIDKGDSAAAQKALAAGSAPLLVLLRSAVRRFSEGADYEEITEHVDAVAIKEMPRMTQRLNYLSLFANIATLLGLLGTVSGLQTSFSSLASAEASKKAAMLAAGIAEAMNMTAFGLMVAVPCMIMYTFLYNTQQRITKDIDESVVRLLSYLKRKKR
ncbi:MAG: MotA/TolQ/ExbB proton channel family protein [Chitinivibrionales bacterium]|nr:MotA/TolQ/ExbB proton channel family protein [Chitinivibrionales bacterium]